MAPPRTIDNLGVDVSTRYAEDKRTLDESLIKEAPKIPTETAIEVTSPYFPSEMEGLFPSQAVHITWASFPAPAAFFEQRKKLFTFQLIPSMGTEDRQESQAGKILAMITALPEDKRPGEVKDKRQQYEIERAYEEKERQKKILISLFTTIAQFDKMIIEINSRRTQYQKG